MVQRARALRTALTPLDRVVGALALVSVVLVLASQVMRLVGVEPYVTLFAVTSEQNIPTWFSSGLLLVAAVAATGVAALVPRDRRQLRLSWCVLAVVLAALSIDDAAALHERLGGLGSGSSAGRAAACCISPG